MGWLVVAVVSALVLGSVVLWRGCRWGSTPEERAGEMPGDRFLGSDAPTATAMTRAISIGAPPERVWPWIAQLGRGAGWYSVDWLDNGRQTSAWHVISWIPEPRLGDATAIGYLRYLEPGRAAAWWVDGVRFFGASSRLVCAYSLEPEENGTRLVSRMSATTAGIGGPVAMFVFRVIDSIMATRQLIGIRDRVEHCEKYPDRPKDPETGDRSQYQLYEVLYADGESAGTAGRERAARWRQSAIADGVVQEDRASGIGQNPVESGGRDGS